ncbi:MAG: Mut7-C RNAse domain-containing protein [Thermodesulfovibrionales bacterium]|nr:Mut7-C RNAse domain-containing protein [Thermodesulfovibrionales bacterium]
MKFITDVMLGRLAKWLRIMGYDTLYYNNISDKNIIDIALTENRALLTKDKGICLIKTVKDTVFYVKSEVLENQILEVANYYKLDILKHAFKRCIRCNIPLEDYKIDDTMHTTYKTCPMCKRLYWRGSHVECMLKTLQDLSSQIRHD